MKFLKLITFQDSRKVAFGLWLFFVACIFMIKKLIISGDWVTCMMLSASLVGGGTIADKWLSSKTDKKIDEGEVK